MAPPILKWPGGKRALAPRIAGLFPPRYGRYIEPFAGGAALFFYLEPRRAVIADRNSELIEVYETVRRFPSEVISRLKLMRISSAEYYSVRARSPRSAIGRAARFLYLNRTAFNGIYRVNRAGRFNVPFGCKPGTVVCDEPALRRAAVLLGDAILRSCDFEEVVAEAVSGDLVYADPPYTTAHDNNGFRRYNESLFSWADQVRLAAALRAAAERGANVAVSNAHHSELNSLYNGFFRHVMERASCIAGLSQHRRSVTEALFTSFPAGGRNG